MFFLSLLCNKLYGTQIEHRDTKTFDKKFRKLIPNYDGTVLLQSEAGYLYRGVSKDEKNDSNGRKSDLELIRKKYLHLCVSSNGNFCLVTDKNKAIVVNTVTGNKTNEFPFNSLQRVCAINNKGNLIIEPSLNKTYAVTKLFDPNNPNKKAIIPGLSAYNLAVATFANEEKKFALGEKNGTISLYSYEGMQQNKKHTINTEHEMQPLDVKFSPDDRKILSSAGLQLFIIDVSSGNVVAKLDSTRYSWIVNWPIVSILVNKEKSTIALLQVDAVKKDDAKSILHTLVYRSLRENISKQRSTTTANFKITWK
jgi:WD40 repeat protein